MSVKELIEAKKANKISFGVRKVLKLAKAKKLKKSSSVYVSKDARKETLKLLDDASVEYEVLKNKNDISKELGIDFDSEVFLVN